MKLLDNFNVKFKRWEAVLLATSAAGRIILPIRAIPATPVLELTRTLPVTRAMLTLRVTVSIGVVVCVSCSLSWWLWTSSCCSRFVRVRRLTICSRKSSCCWLRTLTSWMRTRTWLSWCSRRTERLRFGRESSITSLLIQIWLRPRRGRSSTTLTLRIRSTRYR